MSVFASRTIKVLALPSDPNQTVTIQKLAGRHIKKARQEQVAVAFEQFTRMGGQKAFKQSEAVDENSKAETAAQVKAVADDPMQKYDHVIVMKSAVKSWTLLDDDGTVVPLSPEAIEDLDEETSAWLTREILQLSVAREFQSRDEQETAQGNG